jgi:proline dehydrogenase
MNRGFFIASSNVAGYITSQSTDEFPHVLRPTSLLNRLVVTTLPFIPKKIVGLVSRRYIAGETLDAAVHQIRILNAGRFSTTTDLLGEYITRLDEAEANRRLIETILRTVSEHRLNSTVSIKLSQLGLLLDRQMCYRNVRSLVELAGSFGNRLTIDMEDSTTVDATWEIYYRLHSEGFTNVGMVAQAYLHRIKDDMRKFIQSGGGEIRLCKGIYIEPVSISYLNREDVRRNYLEVLEMLLDGGVRVGIATHDDMLVDRAKEMVGRKRTAKTAYEFQMLLGVREPLRDSILNAGHPLRVYVPFGVHWYAYSVRRLRENPQIAGYVFKAMLGRFLPSFSR